MFKIIHKTELPPIHTSELSHPAWGSAPDRRTSHAANPPPVHLAALGPAKFLWRATGNFIPRNHVRKAQKEIPQPPKLTIDGTERIIKTLEQAKSTAHELTTKIQNLQNQNTTYQNLTAVFRERLSQSKGNADHLHGQIQQLEKLIAEHRQTIAQLDQQIQSLRTAFKF